MDGKWVTCISERPRQFEAREVEGYPGGHKWRRSSLGEQPCPFPFPTRFRGSHSYQVTCGFQQHPFWLLLLDNQMVKRREGLTTWWWQLGTHEGGGWGCPDACFTREGNKAGERLSPGLDVHSLGPPAWDGQRNVMKNCCLFLHSLSLPLSFF